MKFMSENKQQYYKSKFIVYLNELLFEKVKKMG